MRFKWEGWSVLAMDHENNFEKWKSRGRTLTIIPQPTDRWLFEPANQIVGNKLGPGTFYGWLFE